MEYPEVKYFELLDTPFHSKFGLRKRLKSAAGRTTNSCLFWKGALHMALTVLRELGQAADGGFALFH